MTQKKNLKHVAIKHKKKSREMLVQALYSFRLSGNTHLETEAFLLEENKTVAFDRDFFQTALKYILENRDALDQAYAPFCRRSLEALDPIELSILRLSTYEFIQCPDTPYRVIINEALELTKSFGSTEGYKFVNGVLDKLAKVLRD
jgi:transcription antitermination protein NusB